MSDTPKSDDALPPPGRGPWLQTYTGRTFYPLSPRAREVCLDDIAHALSLQCRFSGHCKRFYSVLEHSLLVERKVCSADDALSLAALLHDAAEAYVVDLPRPLKSVLPEYRDIERRVECVIAEHFGLDPRFFQHPEIKQADARMLATEARDLLTVPPQAWEFRGEPYDDLRLSLGLPDPQALRSLFKSRVSELVWRLRRL